MRPPAGLRMRGNSSAVEVPVPPIRAVGPRFRGHAVMAHPLRHRSADRPRDLALRVGHGDVLIGNAESREGNQQIVDRSRALRLGDVGCERVRIMRDPALRVLAPARVLPHDRSPDRPADLHRLRRPALGRDRLFEDIERFWPVGCQVLFRIARVGLDAHQIAPVAAAIGESPRDVTVAADDETGQAGKGHAGDALGGRRPDWIGKHHRRAIPDDRHAD